MLCAHRGAADVRWRLLIQLFVLSGAALSAVAQVANTSVTNSTLTDSVTLATIENVTSVTEATTKKIQVPTEIPGAPPGKADAANKKSNLTAEQPEKQEVKETREEIQGKREDMSETRDVTTKTITEKADAIAGKTNITEEKRVESFQEEESQTESASELALQSVQHSVVVKAPKIHALKSPANGTDYEHDDEYEFEGSGEDEQDEDMEDDDDGMTEYEQDDEETKETSAPTTTTTVAPSSQKPTTTENSAVEIINADLSKEATTESTASSASVPRRPRHSQSGEADFSTAPAPTERPRRRRPNSYKDERRVAYRDGYYPNRSLKRRKTPKQRPAYPKTTPVPVETTPDSNPAGYNQVDADKKAASTTPIPQSRPKRRKKKVRRPKPSKPEERQVPAETRTAIEAAAAAAAAESLRGDLLPTASTAVAFASSPTTPGPRAVRQNDAGVSIQQSDVNPDGSYSFSYDIVDEGRHHKTEVGGPDGVVSGRYGYIDANKRVVNTEYTAGPRGFRATGTDIARKMDLSQIGGGPIPPPDGRYSPEYDGYSDPNEDPSYKFRYDTNTDTGSKVEIADSRGDVKGQYFYFDDEGERHDVKYYAGAGKGFNVRTSFPDNDIPTPLFFPGRGVPPRGRSSILQHRNGAYRFTAVGPDSRREECSDSENYRRGSYVYLDDKGVQRTVIYEAGPNIGFRIITNPNARTPRCPPSKGAPGWENVGLQVGTDGPYYWQGFGAPSPYPPSGHRPEIFQTLPSKYPKIPFESTTYRPPLDTSGKPKPSRRPLPSSTTRPTTYKPGGSSTPFDTDDFPLLDPIPPGPRPPKPTPLPGGSTKNPNDGSTGGSTTPGSTTPNGVIRGPDRSTTRPPSKRPPSGVAFDGSGPANGGGSESGHGPGGTPGGRRPSPADRFPSDPWNPKFDEIFPTTTRRGGYPSTATPAPRPRPRPRPTPGGEGDFSPDGPDGPDGPSGGFSPRPPPYPYPHVNGYQYSCCRDRVLVDPAPVDRFSRARPIRTYIQSIDYPTEDKNGPGRAEDPGVALERHVRDHEQKASRRERSRRRRRRRSVP